MGLIIGVRYVPVARIPLYAGEKQFLAVQVANFVGNFGILAPMPMRIKDKKERYTALANRALSVIDEMVEKG